MLKILLCVSLVFIGVLILNGLYFLTKNYKSMVYPFQRLDNIPEELQIINIGSGPVLFAFDWEKTDFRGLNLAVWPEDFRYDYKILHHFSKHLQKKCQIVILGISPLSFGKNKYLTSDDFSKRYVHVLPQPEVDLLPYKYFLEKYLPLLSKPRRVTAVVKMLLHMEKPPIQPFCDDADETVKRKLADDLMHGWIDSNPPLRNFCDIDIISSFTENFLANRKNVDLIYDFCQDNGFEFYAVVCPVSEYILTHFSKKFLDKFLYENIQKLKVPKDHVLIHLDDDEFKEMENYLNGLFLTKAAQNKFTNKIINELKL